MEKQDIAPMIGLYIHIPFCRAKCNYCDFNSFAGKENLIPGYFDALKTEIAFYGKKLRNYFVKTIFIGGGTPTLVEPDYIFEVIGLCRNSFNMERCSEISVESNPGTLDLKKLDLYKKAGVNRLSIGLQAWQDRLLKQLGRIHDIDGFRDSFSAAREAGFENINIDLIFSLPGQTFNEWAETIGKVAGLGVTHVSCYSLKIEEDTDFGKRLKAGTLIPLDDELDREMYYYTVETLKSHGLRHYELSNFAAPGYECEHNLIYWNAGEYLGLGAGAHSYLESGRYNNKGNIEEYIAFLNSERRPPVENMQSIGMEEKMSEFMILGLRLIEGIDTEKFTARFNKNIFDVYGSQISRLTEKGLLLEDGTKIRLTARGLDLANQVFVEFV